MADSDSNPTVREDMHTILSLIDGAPEAVAAWHRVAAVLDGSPDMTPAPTSEPIRNLEVLVPSETVRQIAEAKTKEHEDKAESYQKQRDDMEAAGTADDDPNLSHDVLRDIKRRINGHREQATFFGFLSSHIPAGRVYQLGIGDLRVLGLTDRHF